LGERGFTTEQVHGGTGPDPVFGARVPPVHLSAGFVFDDFAQARDRFSGEDDGYVYTRLGNPTNTAVERRIAVLEGGTEALLVGSGQAAAAVALLAILQTGDHIVSANSIYEGTRNLFRQNFARLGITVDFVEDTSDARAWAARIRPNTRVLFGESIPNPKNDLLDIELVARVAHRNGIPLVIDNTLATPYLLRPFEYGADIVVHSASKFLAGHGTALGGLVVDSGTFDWAASPTRFPALNQPDYLLGGDTYTNRFGSRAFLAYARDVVAARMGPAPAPFNAFLIQQGIETLSLRVDRQSASALTIARWLEQHPEVASVDYAGLASSPYAELASRTLPRGHGSVFAFTLHGGAEAAEHFVNAAQLFSRMTHLGDVRSLLLHPASTTHAQRTEDERRVAGIWPGMLRLSIGIEDVADLIADLEHCFAAIPAKADVAR
jgi:O-acetylhomoserine (thiol)-lyase